MTQLIFNRWWFKYNTNSMIGIYSLQEPLNYEVTSRFPACLTTGLQICSIYGLYDPVNYGNHPAPFTSDINLQDYIMDALATGTAKPSIPGQKRYVYVVPHNYYMIVTHVL